MAAVTQLLIDPRIAGARRPGEIDAMPTPGAALAVLTAEVTP